MTIEDGAYFVPWVYIPQFSIRRDKLALLVPHLNPLYYRDMWRYISENFKDNLLNALYPNVVHYEIDGLIQRVVMEHRLQCVWNGIGKIEHVGFGGYNRGGDEAYSSFFHGTTFEERVKEIETFIADPYWRCEYFVRSLVEREIGHVLPKKLQRYRMIVPGGWESTFECEGMRSRPRRINSVPVTPDTEFVLDS
jgi:hypothetical protein